MSHLLYSLCLPQLTHIITRKLRSNEFINLKIHSKTLKNRKFLPNIVQILKGPYTQKNKSILKYGIK